MRNLFLIHEQVKSYTGSFLVVIMKTQNNQHVCAVHSILFGEMDIDGE